MADHLAELRSNLERAAKDVLTCRTTNQGGAGDEKAYSTAYLRWVAANNQSEGTPHHIVLKKKYR